jgi:hypothetical protein
VQGSGSQLKSARVVCGGSPQNRPGYFVEPQNQDRRLDGWRCDPGAPRSFKAEDTRRDRKACIEATRRAVAGIRPMVLQRLIPKVPLVGVYPSLGFRGILVFRLSPYKLRRERMAPSLKTLAHLVLLFSLPIFSRFSIGLA